jgi:hypothetical protein
LSLKFRFAFRVLGLLCVTSGLGTQIPFFGEPFCEILFEALGIQADTFGTCRPNIHDLTGIEILSLHADPNLGSAVPTMTARNHTSSGCSGIDTDRFLDYADDAKSFQRSLLMIGGWLSTLGNGNHIVNIHVLPYG